VSHCVCRTLHDGWEVIHVVESLLADSEDRLSVYDETYYNTHAQRKAVAEHLYEAIEPLLRVEEKAEHKALGEALRKSQIQAQKECEKRQKEHEKACRKEVSFRLNGLTLPSLSSLTDSFVEDQV
jgi:hypothetical protein